MIGTGAVTITGILTRIVMRMGMGHKLRTWVKSKTILWMETATST